MNKDEIRDEFGNVIDKINNLDNEECNVFRILGCSKNELKHSYFMRWLLYNKIFFREFVRLCGIQLTEKQLDEKRKINREETYVVDSIVDKTIVDYQESNTYRHIDLNIIGETYTITIENKVDTDQHDDQCISYYNYMRDTKGKYSYIDNKNKFFVFLAKNVDEDQFVKLGGIIPRVKNSEVSLSEYNDLYSKNRTKMVYFNYRLVKYNEIRERILINDRFKKEYEEDYPNKDDIQFSIEIINQYAGLIKEWNELGEEYQGLFENFTDEQNEKFYGMIEDIKSLREGEEESDFGRFLEVANEYYESQKKKYDDYLNRSLMAIISPNITIKTSYGRGGYANALPITLDFIDIDERYAFAKKSIEDKSVQVNNPAKTLDALNEKYDELEKERNTDIKSGRNISADKKIDIKKQREEKRKKIKEKEKILQDYISKEIFNQVIKEEKRYIKKGSISFQTVDFRAPMGGVKHFSVAFLAGLKVSYSRNLCKCIFQKEFYDKYNAICVKYKACENDSTMNNRLICRVINGAGNRLGYEDIEANYSKLYQFVNKHNIELDNIDKFLNIKELYFKDVFCDEFVDFLLNLNKENVLSDENTKKLFCSLFDYFLISNDDSKDVEKLFKKLSEKKCLVISSSDRVLVEKLFDKLRKSLGSEFEKMERMYNYEDLTIKKFVLLSNNKRESGNSKVSFMWALSIIYYIKAIDMKNIRQDELTKEMRDISIEIAGLFNYKKYFEEHLLMNPAL